MLTAKIFWRNVTLYLLRNQAMYMFWWPNAGEAGGVGEEAPPQCSLIHKIRLVKLRIFLSSECDEMFLKPFCNHIWTGLCNTLQNYFCHFSLMFMVKTSFNETQTSQTGVGALYSHILNTHWVWEKREQSVWVGVCRLWQNAVTVLDRNLNRHGFS